MKLAAAVEYCGSRFSGWQYQNHAPSIQQHVEEALSKIADQKIQIHCAGRTDAGVHALSQVIHFETSAARPMKAWQFGCNTHLLPDVSLLWAKIVAEDFHARYSALNRTYRYIIFNRPVRPAINQDLVTWEYRNLNVDLMQKAGRSLIGEHDFTSFRAAGCQSKTAVREIQKLEVFRNGRYIIIEICANAFLQHMVRNIAGVLMEIGMGKAPPEWAQQVLESRDRTLAGVTAPASGLYLTRVDYPEQYQIPCPAADAWPLIL